MTLRLYLDDCIYSRVLRDLLQRAGHDVQTPFEVEPSLAGADDRAHFAHAKRSGRVLITLNVHDFAALHDEDRSHPGMFIVYLENNVRKDMSLPDIVAAIANVETVYESLAGQIIALNHFQW